MLTLITKQLYTSLNLQIMLQMALLQVIIKVNV